MRPTDLDDLAAAIDGDVIDPGSPDYETARLAWNRRFDDARPAAVVRMSGAEDVCTVVEFARDFGLPLTPRGGGHSFAGYSTGDGLIVDLSALTGVAFDARNRTANLGAGLTLLPAYRALWAHEVAIPAGLCPTVGIAGLTAGGGLGALSRLHGLTCDSLVEVEIVTAAGRIERANEHENADLLWATRGGGGGNFGIITSLTFHLVPVDMTFTELTYEFPWSAAEGVVTAWQDWLPGASPQTWAIVELETQAPGADADPFVLLEVVHAGPLAEAEAVVADLLGAAGTAPVRARSHSGPFVDVEHDVFCKGIRAKECTLADKFADGRIPRAALYARSDVAAGPWPIDGIRTLLEWMEARQRDPVLTPPDFSPADAVGKVILEPADAAVNAVAADATAFVHRDNLFVAQFQSRWRDLGSRAVADANEEWTDCLYDAVAEYRSGSAYQNYIDPHLYDWQQAYYGANLAELRRVKTKYDPGNLFAFDQSVPLA